mgnify:CR=1 FL=1
MVDKKWFEVCAKERRTSLRSSNSSSDLYTNAKAGVAVIGIQTSGGGYGEDEIHVLSVTDWEKKEVSLKTVLSRSFRSGRMWPTGISEDGKSFTYTEKSDSGFRSEHTQTI